MAPARPGFGKGRAGDLQARRGCFLGVVGRGRKGRGRTEKSRLRGRFRRSRSILCCVVSVQQGQIQISLLDAAPLLLCFKLPMLHQVKNLQNTSITDEANKFDKAGAMPWAMGLYWTLLCQGHACPGAALCIQQLFAP